MIDKVGKILRIVDLVNLFGIKRQTIYKWESEGGFPKRVKLGTKLFGWQEEEILKWLQDQNKDTTSEAA